MGRSNHIEVRWKVGMSFAWYPAVVLSFNPEGRLVLKYDDEEQPLVLRRDEEWRFPNEDGDA